VFEEHISEMISLLPKDGRTIDFMDWWYRFTLDASTHYLFGQSVGSLSDPKVLPLCLEVIVEFVCQVVCDDSADYGREVSTRSVLESLLSFHFYGSYESS
jgi:hypothetical protein